MTSSTSGYTFERENAALWPELRADLAKLDQDYFDAYLAYRSAVLDDCPFDEKTLELLSLAVDVTVTHMFEPGIRIHMQRALAMGITPKEIMSVIKLATMLGSHSLAQSVPLLTEALANAEIS